MTLNNIDSILTGIPMTTTEPSVVADVVAHEEPPAIEPEVYSPDLSSQQESSTTMQLDAMDTDAYGEPVNKKSKERVYTQDEVNAMIRDRLSRGQHAAQSPMIQQPQAKSQDQFEHNPASDSTWEQQLEGFIESTLSKRDQKLQEQRWQYEQQQTQANFEVKFNAGAQRYADFENVVVGKALTPQMIIATRGMDDPAAFVYAAAKTQAPELERISRLTDPYAQAIELGRLEERMRKIRGTTSSAPKPINMITGDVGDKSVKTLSVDERIRQDAERKRQTVIARRTR